MINGLHGVTWLFLILVLNGCISLDPSLNAKTPS